MLTHYRRKVGDSATAGCLALIGLAVAFAILTRQLDRALHLPAAVFGGVQ